MEEGALQHNDAIMLFIENVIKRNGVVLPSGKHGELPHEETLVLKLGLARKKAPMWKPPTSFRLSWGGRETRIPGLGIARAIASAGDTC